MPPPGLTENCLCLHFDGANATRKNTQNCTKKDLHDPDNHDGVITDLEPDILECGVKWALESITVNTLCHYVGCVASCTEVSL